MNFEEIKQQMDRDAENEGKTIAFHEIKEEYSAIGKSLKNKRNQVLLGALVFLIVGLTMLKGLGHTVHSFIMLLTYFFVFLIAIYQYVLYQKFFKSYLSNNEVPTKITIYDQIILLKSIVNLRIYTGLALVFYFPLFYIGDIPSFLNYKMTSEQFYEQLFKLTLPKEALILTIVLAVLVPLLLFILVILFPDPARTSPNEEVKRLEHLLFELIE